MGNLVEFKADNDKNLFISCIHIPRIGEQVQILNDLYLVVNVRYRLGTDDITVFLKVIK
jgi:hypothetical protein